MFSKLFPVFVLASHDFAPTSMFNVFGRVSKRSSSALHFVQTGTVSKTKSVVSESKIFFTFFFKLVSLPTAMKAVALGSNSSVLDRAF